MLVHYIYATIIGVTRIKWYTLLTRLLLAIAFLISSQGWQVFRYPKGHNKEKQKLFSVLRKRDVSRIATVYYFLFKRGKEQNDVQRRCKKKLPGNSMTTWLVYVSSLVLFHSLSITLFQSYNVRLPNWFPIKFNRKDVGIGLL